MPPPKPETEYREEEPPEDASVPNDDEPPPPAYIELAVEVWYCREAIKLAVSHLAGLPLRSSSAASIMWATRRR